MTRHGKTEPRFGMWSPSKGRGPPRQRRSRYYLRCGARLDFASHGWCYTAALFRALHWRRLPSVVIIISFLFKLDIRADTLGVITFRRKAPICVVPLVPSLSEISGVCTRKHKGAGDCVYHIFIEARLKRLNIQFLYVCALKFNDRITRQKGSTDHLHVPKIDIYEAHYG